MKLTIQVKGELVRQGLQDLAAEIPKIGRRQIRTVTNRVVRRMQAYPGNRIPERTGEHPILGRIITKHTRTGLYGRSWKIEEVASGYRIENTAARKGRQYGVYVGGDAYGNHQQWYHAKTKWLLLKDVVDEEILKLPPEIESEITTAAHRKGL